MTKIKRPSREATIFNDYFGIWVEDEYGVTIADNFSSVPNAYKWCLKHGYKQHEIECV